jgi:MSHA biogenesis protein MshL
LVVVKALPRELHRVRDFLERSELSVKRQVILETKILEVRLNDQFEAGINWSAINGQILLGKNVSEFASPNEIITASESVGEVFASLIKVDDISTLLDLLETQGAVQVLSSPRVSTVNNQKAVIRVGNDEFFVTGLSSDTVSNASSTTSTPDLELSSFFSGIALDVTPQIADDGDVILHIHPMVTQVEDQIKELTLGDSKFSIPLAVREIRESDSIVRAKHGQVVVLGGLMQETSTESQGKRPWIGDVPVVNSLFKTKNHRKFKTELVILMRPIVVDDEAWKNSVNESQNRIKSISDNYRKVFN